MYRASQLIASGATNYSLKDGAQTVAIDFIGDWNMEALLDRLHSGDTLSLHFERLRGNDLLPVIDIYLNVDGKAAQDEKHYVDSMGLYGLGESSTPSREHEGQGQERLFEVGPLFQRLHGRTARSPERLLLTLVPGRPLPEGAVLTIGRIALYLHQF